MSNQLVALVTGANKGIGLQIAKDLAAKNIRVLVGARDLAAGEAAARTIDGATAIQLDVTNAASIAAASARITKELGRLDILVNNAGISSTLPATSSFEEVLAATSPSGAPLDTYRDLFATNVFGVVAVTQAMLPLLREAPAGRIVNVSSSLGSLATMSDPNNPYRTVTGPYAISKTALNGVTVAFASELSNTRIKVNAACPGYTATYLNRFQGTRTVEQAAHEPVRLALLDENGPTGTFSNDAGPLPW